MFWVLMYLQRQEKQAISGSNPISSIRAYSPEIEFCAPKRLRSCGGHNKVYLDASLIQLSTSIKILVLTTRLN